MMVDLVYEPKTIEDNDEQFVAGAASPARRKWKICIKRPPRNGNAIITAGQQATGPTDGQGGPYGAGFRSRWLT